MEDEFINNTETLLATVVRLFAIDGCAKEVAVLANSKSYVEQTDCGGWNSDIYGYTINLKVNLNLYTQIESVRNEIEENIKTKLNSIVVDNWHYYEKILISPELSKDPDWRVKANNWLKGDTISNQGRVRSDNIASKSCDGLLFR
ncbi:MAG: hypothetical protein WCQ54_06115, partial [Clostridiaceae bacterium]